MQVNIPYIERLGTGELHSTTHSCPRKDSDQIPSDPTVKLLIVVSSGRPKIYWLGAWTVFCLKQRSVYSQYFACDHPSWCLKMKDQTRLPWKWAIFLSDTKSWIATNNRRAKTPLLGGQTNQNCHTSYVLFASWWFFTNPSETYALFKFGSFPPGKGSG